MRFTAFILAFALSLTVMAAEVRVYLDSDTVIAGEPFTLSVETSGATPDISAFPAVKNLLRLSNRPSVSRSSQINIVNGKRRSTETLTMAFPLVAEKSGEYIIPAFEVKIKGKAVKTSPLKFKAVPAGEQKVGRDSITLDEAVMAKIIIPDKRRTFFIGEEIPLEVDVFICNGVMAQLTAYPELNVPNGVFRDYRQINPESPVFGSPFRKPGTVLDGRRYSVLAIPTAFRALASGNLNITGKIQVGIEEQSRRRSSFFDDDFLTGFMGRSMRKFVIDCTAAPELTIVPLPAVPEKMNFIGLTGVWTLDCKLSASNGLKVGETVSLDIAVKGKGSTETLKAPALSIPGFRAYPPEIRKSLDGVTVSYNLIPLRPGSALISVNPAVFNPLTGKYENRFFEKRVEILPSDRPLAGMVAVAAPDKKPEVKAPAVSGDKQSMYIKTINGTAFTLPVWRQHLGLSIIFFIAGPVLCGVIVLWRRTKEKQSGDSGFLRRKNARKECRKVIADLEKSNSNFDECINGRLVPVLAQLLDMPPGSTAEELADKVEDSELASALRNAAGSSYMPSAAAGMTANRKGVIKALKKMVALAVCLFAVNAGASAFEEGITLYDKGDFSGAYKKFEAEKKTPQVFYNMGAASFMLQDYPQAELCFERAYLMNPRDTEALGSLNLARRKLGLPEIGTVSSPSDMILYLRSIFLPGEWILAASLLWFCFWLTLGFCRRKRYLCAILLFLAAFAATMAVWQCRESYSIRRAVALGNGAEIYSLPSASGRETGRIPGGMELEIMEKRSDYSLVKSRGAEGWVKNSHISGLWDF